mmetsp:Transcript_18305/g.56142  ORF Transcript_18305/g.56142 Transcript_18305/m.56142 type:complete len:347 (-) Transcript_18305:75-1115(-)
MGWGSCARHRIVSQSLLDDDTRFRTLSFSLRKSRVGGCTSGGAVDDRVARFVDVAAAAEDAACAVFADVVVVVFADVVVFSCLWLLLALMSSSSSEEVSAGGTDVLLAPSLSVVVFPCTLLLLLLCDDDADDADACCCEAAEWLLLREDDDDDAEDVPEMDFQKAASRAFSVAVSCSRSSTTALRAKICLPRHFSPANFLEMRIAEQLSFFDRKALKVAPFSSGSSPASKLRMRRAAKTSSSGVHLPLLKFWLDDDAFAVCCRVRCSPFPLPWHSSPPAEDVSSLESLPLARLSAAVISPIFSLSIAKAAASLATANSTGATVTTRNCRAGGHRSARRGCGQPFVP